jgi:hypothetical protein
MCVVNFGETYCSCWQRDVSDEGSRRCWATDERCALDRAHGGKALPGEEP